MEYHCIVVGAGHAGIEAALATARLGFKTLLITQNPDKIGVLSCNPAIGGLSKGNLVREVDALGGQMASLIDKTLIQYRVLNRSRGPAVQAPRAQADKAEYHAAARKAVESQPGLELFMDTVTDLLISPEEIRQDGTLVPGACVRGVQTERGHSISADTVILATGTFMEGRIFIGEYDSPQGRLGETAALGLGTALRRLGFPVGRLKTGTPARIAAESVDFSKLERQDGEEAKPFSFLAEPDASLNRPSVPCWICFTNEKTHEIIRQNIHRSPLFGGKILGVGPRYCPSLEDKVVRFPDRTRHHVFIEPESLGTNELYMNGASSSLPEDVQTAFIRSIIGLEEVHIVRPAYAVEYDYLDPLDLYPSLESKRLGGLFVAGQTNGSSGYEEAAAQGIMAGINAAMKLSKRPPLILKRSEAYTGVLIDDLTTIGTNEPYRMFTSRAEHRLMLRHDSADSRLTPYGRELGLVSDERWEHFSKKCASLDEITELLHQRKVQDSNTLPDTMRIHLGDSYERTLCDTKISLEDILPQLEELSRYPREWLERAALDIKYAGYIEKEKRAAARTQKMEAMKLPADLDYTSIKGLSAEACEKLQKVKPLNLGQAARTPGVRQGDIAVLMVWDKQK